MIDRWICLDAWWVPRERTWDPLKFKDEWSCQITMLYKQFPQLVQIKRKIKMWDLVTWIRNHSESGVSKVTVPVVSSPGLVVEVHGHRGAVYESFRGVAWTSLLHNPAIHLRARVVYVCQQRCLVRWRLGHAPSFLHFFLFRKKGKTQRKKKEEAKKLFHFPRENCKLFSFYRRFCLNGN